MTTPLQQPPPQLPSVDQIVKGNVTIKKLSNHKYKINLTKIGKFLIYQVWNKDNIQLNNKRIVQYVSAKNWVNSFTQFNKYLHNNHKHPFTPTTIINTHNNNNHPFVIHNAFIKIIKNLLPSFIIPSLHLFIYRCILIVAVPSFSLYCFYYFLFYYIISLDYSFS
jgi:hypothetical protein